MGGADLNGTASGDPTDLRFNRPYRAIPTGLYLILVMTSNLRYYLRCIAKSPPSSLHKPPGRLNYQWQLASTGIALRSKKISFFEDRYDEQPNLRLPLSSGAPMCASVLPLFRTQEVGGRVVACVHVHLRACVRVRVCVRRSVLALRAVRARD
eukprot:6199609-Pleurochrysis_carterae.AAC.9